MPKMIGKYQIQRVLGKGSMGVVYEAFDPDIKRRVAIKTLTPNIGDEALVREYHQRFRIEAQASARCMHPNIVMILDYGEYKGMPFLVMEYIKGQPLNEVLKADMALSLNRVMRIMSQLLKALHFAHSSKVVHRDIKPSNIMVLGNGSVKVTDFGIARVPNSGNVTQVGYSVGTPNYMAPEQEQSSEVDARADLYSLSIIFLELMAKIPFSSALEKKTLNPKGIHITSRVNILQAIPVGFLPLLQKGLAADKDQRFASAKAFATELKKAVNGLKNQSEETQVLVEKPMEIHPTTDHGLKQRQREMAEMLCHFIGPIGNNIVEMHAEDCVTISELATSVAEEITNEEERKRFLEVWRADEEITEAPSVTTLRIETQNRPAGERRRAAERVVNQFRLDGVQRKKVESLFAEYVGPMAGLLLSETLEQAMNFDDLIEALSASIPSPDEQTDFKIKVRNLTS